MIPRRSRPASFISVPAPSTARIRRAISIPCWRTIRAGASPRSRCGRAARVEALAAQDGLYTLAVLDREPSMRVIGAHREWIGPGGGAQVASLLAKPDVRIVTSTVTEKGYCLAGDGTLDKSHPDIVADLQGGEPRSFVGWLVQGLAAPACCRGGTLHGPLLRQSLGQWRQAARGDDRAGSRTRP
jgi:hypothetical protein